jgi:hypothetical protein
MHTSNNPLQGQNKEYHLQFQVMHIMVNHKKYKEDCLDSKYYLNQNLLARRKNNLKVTTF